MAGSVGQYTQGWFPWVGHKSDVGGVARENFSDRLGMGRAYTADALNSEVVWPLYLDSVTWKVALVHQKSPNYGIATLLWDGASVGAIDLYDASGVGNAYAEVTGISIPAPKAADFTVRAASKNASATGYFLVQQSWCWIRTGGTPSTPAGTDTPGYTWEWIPWMGAKANTGWASRLQSSAHLGGGRHESAGTQNDLINSDFHYDTGTFKFALVYYKDTNRGIFHVRLDSVDQTTIDGYAAAGTDNVFTEVTGLVIAAGVKNFELKMATKNASAISYIGSVMSAKWIRTGA